MKTKKDFTTNFKHYGLITVPAGTETTNKTAVGIDPNYNFVNEFGWVAKNYPELKNIMMHDLIHYGINVPKEYL